MGDSIVGFNGEYPDPIMGASHTGNGYRACNPVLLRFNCPDSMSPFRAGGINPYAYCTGDPVNRTDPSGHFSLGQSIGVGLGMIAGMALGMATGGAAMPAVFTLMVSVAGGCAIGALSELASEAIDGRPLDWCQVSISAGESALAELLGFGVSRAFRPIKGGIYGVTNSQVTSANVIPLGGTRTLYGINADFGYNAFTDTYANKPRFNIVGHGTHDDGGHIKLGSRNLSAAALAGQIKEAIPENIQSVRLVMCCSADNGKYSFAQKLANELNLPVKAFHGLIAVKKPFIGSLGKLNHFINTPSDLQAWKTEIADLSELPFLEKNKFNYDPRWFYPENLERSWHNPTDFMCQNLLKRL